jgi:hypothetical protein
MTTAMLENVLHVALLTPMGNPHSKECRWGAPILLWGSPGIGKSGRVEQVGAAARLPVETLYLSTLQPEDLSGVPMANAHGGITNVCTLSQIQVLIDAQKGVLFLDELTTARPAVQGAGLAVVYERMIAGKRLPGRVRVVGAANPPEEAAGGWNLALPMANRFLHLDVKVPSAEEWAAWLLSDGDEEIITIESGEDAIRSGWESKWPKMRGLGAGFVKRNAGLLYKVPAAGHKDRGRAWPSPRSWMVALRCVAAAEALGMPELGLDLLRASVGDGPCKEWIEWVNYANLPDPKDVLEHGWRANRDRLDVAFAVFSSAISYALSKQDPGEKDKYALMAWELLAVAVKDNVTDLALAPAAALMRAGYTTKKGGNIEKVCKPVIARFGETGMANYVRKA